MLVVDDNVDGARTLSLLVGMHGHETAVAHNGPDALDGTRDVPAAAGLRGHRPAWAQRLRGGPARARRERRRDAASTVILVALTGWGSDEDKTRSREAGFDSHLTKPVDPHEVEALLNGLLRTGPAGKSQSAV